MIDDCAVPACKSSFNNQQSIIINQQFPMEDLRKPILPGKGASDYERYLRTDELLSLQKLPQELLHEDEVTFQVVHQASELLLKGVAWELERARDHIGDGDFLNAGRLMRRATQMLDHPIYLLHVLETITPYDYHLIRAGLGHGSGLDSPGFLALLHIGPRSGGDVLLAVACRQS